MQTGLRVGLAVLLAIEVLERLSILQHRARHRVDGWWSDLESRERSRTRQTEIAVLASRLQGRRRPPSIRSG